mgnify:CR=1 FL=1
MIYIEERELFFIKFDAQMYGVLLKVKHIRIHKC